MRGRIGPPRRRRGGFVAVVVAVTLVAFPAAAVATDRTAFPVGYGTKAVDARRDPWIAVTDAMVAPELMPRQLRVRRTRRITVDYDGDGVADEAWMVRNSRQMGVMVRLGGSHRMVLAFRADDRWGDQSLFRIGSGAIGIEFPESTVVVLSEQNGHPMVHYPDEGGR